MKMIAVITLALGALLLGPVPAAHAELVEPRSPATATLLSLGGLAASGLTIAAGAAIGGDAGVTIGLVGAGSLLFTPSAGHFYSGNYLSTGLITRAAGTAAMGLGLVLLIRSLDFFDANHDDGGEAAGMIAFFGGGVAFVTGTLLDVAMAGTAAQAWNAKHGFTLAPTAISTPSGTSAGLGFSGRF